MLISIFKKLIKQSDSIIKDLDISWLFRNDQWPGINILLELGDHYLDEIYHTDFVFSKGDVVWPMIKQTLVMSKCLLISHVWLIVTQWAVACQVFLSTEFSRQEYWSG